jgi:hypothetical protein
VLISLYFAPEFETAMIKGNEHLEEFYKFSLTQARPSHEQQRIKKNQKQENKLQSPGHLDDDNN